jgi:uncharacterized phage infection (PIP) family protein YhgE
MTDDELKRLIADLTANVEAHTLSLDRLEDAMLADRERSNQLERVVLSLTRLYDRERKSLRAGLDELAAAQANTERNLTLMIEHFDRKVDALAAGEERLQQGQERLQQGHERLQQGQERLQEGYARLQQGQVEMQAAIAEMTRAVIKTNERVDSLENGQP